jgi:hypothetical protein
MRKAIMRILACVALLFAAWIGITLVGSVAQVAAAADRVSMGAGQPVFFALLAVMLVLVLVPIGLFLRLPAPLVAPAAASGPEHDEYLRRLKAQLARNPALAGMPLGTDAELAAALARLDAEAQAVIRNTASAIFASTAVMQNGRLDALIVFGSQVRMTWRIASIYFQRPTPRQLLFVYGNVGANMLVAENLQDVDFSGIVAPVVVAVFPSLKGAVPGLQGVSTLLVNSMAHGAANAFLTLRVGHIAREYCAPLVRPDRAVVRRSATVAAVALVGAIAREQGARVAQAAWNGVTGAVQSTAMATVNQTRSTFRRALDRRKGER